MLPKVSGSNAIAFGIGFAIFSAVIGYYAHGLSYHYTAESFGIWVVLYPSILVGQAMEKFAGQNIYEQLLFILAVQFVAGILAYEIVAFVGKAFRKRKVK
jgi:uncharacterized membrane protein